MLKAFESGAVSAEELRTMLVKAGWELKNEKGENNRMDITLLTSFIGILAVLLRTLLPYVEKLKEAEEKGEALP